MAKRAYIKNVVKRIQKRNSSVESKVKVGRYEFALADRVDFLNGRHWDQRVAFRGVFMSRRYLRVLEAHGPHNFKQRYGLVYRDGKPILAVAMQVVDLVAGDLVKPLPSQAQNQRPDPSVASDESNVKSKRARLLASARKAGKRTLDRVKFRVLVCGDLMSWGGTGVALAPDESPEAGWQLVHEVLERVRRQENLEKKSDFVLVKDISEAQDGPAEALKKFRFKSLATEPDMVMEIPEAWKGYDDYLAGLNSRYRKGAKGISKRLKKEGGVVELLHDVRGAKDELYQLYMQVQAKADVRINTLTPDFIPAMAKALGADFRCQVLRNGPGGEMLGFVTTLRSDDAAVGYFIGFNKEMNARMPLYLSLLHAVVSDAISMGCKRLSFGRTALDPKARLGAKPVHYGVLIRHRQPLINLSIPSMLRVIPHGEPPERNPFK